jgi:hypothetical protein
MNFSLCMLLTVVCCVERLSDAERLFFCCCKAGAALQHMCAWKFYDRSRSWVVKAAKPLFSSLSLSRLLPHGMQRAQYIRSSTVLVVVGTLRTWVSSQLRSSTRSLRALPQSVLSQVDAYCVGVRGIRKLQVPAYLSLFFSLLVEIESGFVLDGGMRERNGVLFSSSFLTLRYVRDVDVTFFFPRQRLTVRLITRAFTALCSFSVSDRLESPVPHK